MLSETLFVRKNCDWTGEIRTGIYRLTLVGVPGHKARNDPIVTKLY